MIRFWWLTGCVMVAAMSACSDDGALTSATVGMSEGSTGTTDTTSTGTTTEAPTTGTPTTTGTASGTTTTDPTGSTTTTDPSTTTTDPSTTTGSPTTDTTTTGVTTDTTTMAPGECGDGTIDDGETCDDGNTDPGDGCDAECQLEDEVCDPDGLYTVEGPAIVYTCCNGLVNLTINAFTLSGDAAQVTSSPTNPVAMTGAATTCPDGDFSNAGVLAGGCTETYSVSGSFTDPNTWTGTYSLEFVGDDCSCFNGVFGTPCINQDFPVTATR